MRSWQMSDKKRYVSYCRSPIFANTVLSLGIFEAARKKALAVGAKKFFLEVCQISKSILFALNPNERRYRTSNANL